MLQHLNVFPEGAKTERGIRGAASPVLSTRASPFCSPADYAISDTWTF